MNKVALRSKFIQYTSILIIAIFMLTGINAIAYENYDESNDEDYYTGSSIALKLSARVEDETVYDKIVFFNKWLVDNVEYDYEAYRITQQGGSYDIEGQYASNALLDGKCVCAGYAKAFKMLCDNSNIPCIIITGNVMGNNGLEPHMWNAVYVADKWLICDVTWNDSKEDTEKYLFKTKESIDNKRMPEYNQADASIKNEYPDLPKISTFKNDGNLDLTSIGGPVSPYSINIDNKVIIGIAIIIVIVLIIIIIYIIKLKSMKSGY